MISGRKVFELSGKAFVTFDKPSQAEYIKIRFKKSKLKVWFTAVKKVFITCFCRKRLKNSVYDITVRRAPEPSDVEWENLALYTSDKLKMRAKIFVLVLLVIVLSFLIILGITSIQIEVENENQGEESPWITILNLFSSASLGILDPIIGLICIALTKQEGHSTRTHFSSISAQRVAVYKFFNFTFTTMTAKIVMSSHAIKQSSFGFFQSLNFYGPSGVIPCMFITLMGNLWSNPILVWFDPIYIMKKNKQKKLEKLGFDNLLCQEEAHELF